jgi:hypothetical protein
MTTGIYVSYRYQAIFNRNVSSIAKNAKRRKQLLKITEENSRKNIEEQEEKKCSHEPTDLSSSYYIEMELEKVAAAVDDKDNGIQKQMEASFANNTQAKISGSSPQLSTPKTHTRNVPIVLKRGLLHDHVHRFHRHDIGVVIKRYKSEDEEQQAIQNAL